MDDDGADVEPSATRSSLCETAGSSESCPGSSSASSVSRQRSISVSSDGYRGATSGSSESQKTAIPGSSRSKQAATSSSSVRNRHWTLRSSRENLHSNSSSSESFQHTAAASGSSENDIEDPDRKRLLEIFPKRRIWYIILQNLFGTDVIVTMLNSSLFFRSMLFDHKTEQLFSQVWNILGTKYEEKKDVVYDEREPRDNQARNERRLPLCSGERSTSFVMGDLTFCSLCRRRRYTRSYSGILKLRLVNKTWSKVIDQFYQTPRELWLNQEDTTTDLPPLDNNLEHWREDKFASFRVGTSLAREFLQHFRSTHEGKNRSPFLGKSVFFQFKLIDHTVFAQVLQEYLNEIMKILTKYGVHIDECAIKVERDRSILQEDSLLHKEYILLWRILHEMPNLKSLYLNTDSNDEDLRETDDETQRKLVQFMELLGQRPLAQLESLDYICSRLSCSFILNEILSRNNHITKLQLVESRAFFQKRAYAIPFPNLINLWINISTVENFSLLLEPEVNWSLTKLRIGFEASVILDWTQLFEVLQKKWDNTVLDLEVRLPQQNNRLIFTPDMLRLRRIQTLTVAAPENASLDFILTLKETLEELNVEVVRANYVVSPIPLAEKKLMTIACNRKLNSSKTWEIFQKLKCIRVTGNFRDRSEIEMQWFGSFNRYDWERCNASRRGWLRCPCL